MGSRDRYVWCTVPPNRPVIWKEDYNCVEDLCFVICLEPQMRLQLSDVQSAHSLIPFFLISPPFIPYNTQYSVFVSLTLVPFPLFSPSPTSTLPSFFSLCLKMDFVMFEDVFAAGVYWSLLMAESKERKESRNWRHAAHRVHYLNKKHRSCSYLCVTHARG